MSVTLVGVDRNTETRLRALLCRIGQTIGEPIAVARCDDDISQKDASSVSASLKRKRTTTVTPRTLMRRTDSAAEILDDSALIQLLLEDKALSEAAQLWTTIERIDGHGKAQYCVCILQQRGENEKICAALASLVKRDSTLCTAYRIVRNLCNADMCKRIGDGHETSQAKRTTKSTTESPLLVIRRALGFVEFTSDSLRRYDLLSAFRRLLLRAEKVDRANEHPAPSQTASAGGVIDCATLRNVREKASHSVVEAIDEIAQFDEFLYRSLETLPGSYTAKKAAIDVLPFFLLVKSYVERICRRKKNSHSDALSLVDAFSARFSQSISDSNQLALRSISMPWHVDEHIAKGTPIGKILGGKLCILDRTLADAFAYYLRTVSNCTTTRNVFTRHFCIDFKALPTLQHKSQGNSHALLCIVPQK